MKKKITTEMFIERAKIIHKNLYDYSKAIYTKMEDQVILICQNHGEFPQTPHSHLKGAGCRFCAIEKRSNENDWNKLQKELKKKAA